MFLRLFVATVFSVAVFGSDTAVAQAPQPSEPYAVVHGWPQLPDGFVLGQVSGVAVDSHNHVFVFHRAENSWAADKTHAIASATVLCFEGSSGKLLSSWDRFLLPRPFSRNVVAYGEPFPISAEQTEEAALSRVAAALDGATAEADEAAGLAPEPRRLERPA